ACDGAAPRRLAPVQATADTGAPRPAPRDALPAAEGTAAALSGATFTDANPGDHSADFSATIHWGDGSSSAGTVSYNSTTHSYTVVGNPTYTNPVTGSYPIPVSAFDDNGNTTTITP